MNKVFFSLVLGCLLAVQCFSAEKNKTLELSKSGKSDYVIVQNANATAAEKYATEELSNFLEKVTGAKFNIENESDLIVKKKAIYVGWTDYAKNNINLSSLGEEEWIIKTQDENLILTGGRPRGTLYSVYEFLEQQIGCHWLDEFTEIIPTQTEVSLKELNIRGRPAFSNRCVTEGSLRGYYWNPELVDAFHARNRGAIEGTSAKYGFGGAFGGNYGSPGGCHTYYAYLKEWQDAHPEYLAMNEKGERVRSVKASGPGQICVTHPEGRKMILEQLRQFIIKDREKAAKDGTPIPKIYAVESNDNQLICQCPGCKAVMQDEKANSGADLALANYLADGIKDEFPDVMVDIFAYGTTLHPPKKLKPRDNVVIRFAMIADHVGRPLDGIIGHRSADRPDFFRPITHPVNSLQYEMLMTWTICAKNIHIWDYWRLFYDGKTTTPYIIIDTIKANLEFYQDIGIQEIFVECQPQYALGSKVGEMSFFHLTRWAGLKLLQNPRQPLEPLIKIFMAGYYGPAAGKMYEYMDYMKKRINACPETMKISRLKPEGRPYLDLEFFVTSKRLLDEAEALCVNDKNALLNVRRERIIVDLSLVALWLNLKSKLPKGETMPFDSDIIIKRCEDMRLEQIEAFWANGKDKARDVIKKEAIKAKLELSNSAVKLNIPRISDANGNPSGIDRTKASPLKWYSLFGVDKPARQVKGSIAHDGRYLYILLEEKIDKGNFQCNEWAGDDWEIFIAEQRNGTSMQIGIFPDGKVICNEHTKTADGGESLQLKKNSGVVVKSTNKNGNWQVQVLVPLSEFPLKGATPGKDYFMNIYRVTPKGESLCISPTFSSGGYNDLSRAAVIKLEK